MDQRIIHEAKEGEVPHRLWAQMRYFVGAPHGPDLSTIPSTWSGCAPCGSFTRAARDPGALEIPVPKGRSPKSPCHAINAARLPTSGPGLRRRLGGIGNVGDNNGEMAFNEGLLPAKWPRIAAMHVASPCVFCRLSHVFCASALPQF